MIGIRKMLALAVALVAWAADAGVLRRESLPAEVCGEIVNGIVSAERLEVRLFDDAQFGVELVKRTAIRDSLNVFGRTENSPVLNVVLTSSGRGVLMSVHDMERNRIYEVSIKDGHGNCRELEAVQSSGADAIPGAGAAVVESEGSPAGARRLASSAEKAPEPYVDILLVYDAQAARYVASSYGDLNDFSELQIERMNMALMNTGLDQLWLFRLKGITVLQNALGDDVENVLDAVLYNDAITSRREETDADIVSVMIDTGSEYGTTGVSYSLTNPRRPSDFAESAYNVCSIRAVEASYTLSHEVGHIMGAGHAREQYSDPGPQSYDYSSGYYFSAGGSRYCTIMAYRSEGPGGIQVPYFSSPLFKYKGVAVGDEDHDNTRALQNLYRYVTLFRKDTGKKFSDYDHSVVLFSEEDGVVDMPLSLELKALDSGAEIRYTLDGSEPSSRSTRYTGAIKLTDTTTVKAVVVKSGKAGPVYQATYIANDIGLGVNQPDWEWRHSLNPWKLDFDDSHDGECSVRSYDGPNAVSWIETTLTGPGKLSFWFKPRFVNSVFAVFSDDDEIYEYARTVSLATWKSVELEIPAGSHDVGFYCLNGSNYYEYGFTGVYLDEIKWAGPVEVKIDLNGGTGSQSVWIAKGTRLESVPKPTRVGYTFQGWYTARTGGTRLYDAYSVSGSLSVYAHWKANEYTVRFDANGGKGMMSDAKFTYGVSGYLAANAFAREGCTFLGWARNKSGAVEFEDGAEVQNLALSGEVTLYARWRRDRCYIAGEDATALDLGSAKTYDGVIVAADGSPVGVLNVKLQKKAKSGASKVTASVQMAGEKKKVSIKGSVDDGAVMNAVASDGRVLDLRFTGGTMLGYFDGYEVDGTRNVVAASARTPEAKAEKSAAEALVNRYKGGYVMAFIDQRGWNGLSVQIQSKGKVKVTGTLADGTKVTASGQMIIGRDYCGIPIVFAKNGVSLGFCIYIENATSEMFVFGNYDATVSPVTGLGSGQRFEVNESLGGLLSGYSVVDRFLPSGITVEEKGGKWTVAGGAKAGQIKLVGGEAVDVKESLNPSGLKLTYTAKTGIFKGSFKIYALDARGKLKNFTVNVNGIVVDGYGYGTATVKKAGGVPVVIR